MLNFIMYSTGTK